MKLHRTLLFSAALLAWTLVSGCKKEEVTVYSIPKPEAEPPATEMTGANEPAQPVSPVQGEVPTNWIAQPLSEMRQASYQVKGDKGALADVSLVVLAGDAGGMLENINRWLSQLGKPAITADQLAQIAQHDSLPDFDVTLVDFEGLPQGADPAKDGRIIAGIASNGGNTWFFKMRGNSALVESQKKAFVDWIDSVAALAAGANGGSAAPGSSALPQNTASAPEKPQIKWDVPPGWKTVAPSAMRYASFTIAGPGGEPADVSVSVFDGDGGGDLENINRWRGQAGLGPIQADGLKSLIVPVIAKDGDVILTTDISGPKSRILAAWARNGGRAWFFKLSGEDKAVAAQKDAFAKFLQSVEFHS